MLELQGGRGMQAWVGIEQMDLEGLNAVFSLGPQLEEITVVICLWVGNWVREAGPQREVTCPESQLVILNV